MNEKAYLEAISKFGSISRAARKLYISQPYLSMFIKGIEAELGVTLIDREQSPITLTYAGERYLSYMSQIEALYQKMEYEFQEISDLKRGRLKIGVNPMLASHNLYNILPEFIKINPGIEVELIEDNSKHIEQLLEQQEIDISLTILPIDNQKIDYEILYSEDIYLLIPNQHTLINKYVNNNNEYPFAFNELNHQRFILLKSDMTLRKLTDRFFDDYKISPRIVMETISVDNAMMLASEGLGMTFVPESVKSNNKHKHAHYFKLDPIQYSNSIAVAYHKDVTLSKAADAFIELALQTFKTQP